MPNISTALPEEIYEQYLMVDNLFYDMRTAPIMFGDFQRVGGGNVSCLTKDQYFLAHMYYGGF